MIQFVFKQIFLISLLVIFGTLSFFNYSIGQTPSTSVPTSPTQIDLIIESGTFTPPFYKGRSAFVSQGSTKIIAIPHITVGGIITPTSKLNFRWKKDGNVITASSGFGKNVISINGSVPIRDIDIELTILDQSNNQVAQTNTTVTPYDPAVIFYENSPLYGILFNSTLQGTVDLKDKEEINVSAYPLYFNVEKEDSFDVSFKWKVNGKTTSTDGPINRLLLRRNSDTSGSTRISMNIDGLNRIFQYASASFYINY